MLSNIIKFTKLLFKFQGVERALKVFDQERFENDSEHSYNLAMMAWYLIDSQKINLDKNLVLKYALVHDFSEIYAGDTYIYTTNLALKESKHQREEEAINRLSVELPEFPDLHEFLNKYETRNDEESKFVYALDKLMPIIDGYIENGRNWRRQEITLQMIIDNKAEKIAICPHLIPHYDEIIRILRNESSSIF